MGPKIGSLRRGLEIDPSLSCAEFEEEIVSPETHIRRSIMELEVRWFVSPITAVLPYAPQFDTEVFHLITTSDHAYRVQNVDHICLPETF